MADEASKRAVAAPDGIIDGHVAEDRRLAAGEGGIVVPIEGKGAGLTCSFKYQVLPEEYAAWLCWMSVTPEEPVNWVEARAAMLTLVSL